MGEEKKTTASQWGLVDKEEQDKKEEPVEKEKDEEKKPPLETPEKDADEEPGKKFREITYTELMKRRGFFEAVSHIECPVKRMTALLEEFRQEASERISEVNAAADVHIDSLREQIEVCKSRITELNTKVKDAELYKEDEDEVLKKLVAEKNSCEEELAALRDRLTEVRIKLGEAKAGIIDRSLVEAEEQVKRALNIQKTIYDETYLMNQKKFVDEKDHLTRLAKCYQALLVFYEERYQKINRHLTILDVDGINPVTTKALIWVGNVSFAAAGFFFSTFAGATGFGNQGMLNFILQGFIDTAQQPGSIYYKIAILLGLIVLVTLISIGCNYLLNRLKKKSEEEIMSEMMLGGEVDESEDDQMKFHAKVKSNNWYAFWLQLIPGVFIAGLIILAIAIKASPGSIGAINASSEGLIAGTGLAIALAGLIYFYIIKIVEPRLVRKYNANPDMQVNWARANWELVVVVAFFLLFCICIVAIPYNPGMEFNIIPVDQRTRFSILLFIGVALGGSTAFAYSIRSHGLIETSRWLEAMLEKLHILIGRCSAPRSPMLHNTLSEDQGNVVQHVLKQLLFKASLNITQPAQRVRVRPLTFFEKVAIALKLADKPKVQDPPPVVPLLPWEEKYFPHLTDEVKAIEFEYREKKSKCQQAADNVDDHKAAKATELRRWESDIEKCRQRIETYNSEIRKVLKEKALQCRQIRDTCNVAITDLQDGFHLGMYYRENGIGPRPGYYDYCAPNNHVSPQLLITSNT